MITSGLDLSVILSTQWKIFDFKNSMSPSILQLYKQILHLKENLKVSNERNIFLPSNKRFRPDKNQSGIVSKTVLSRFISIYFYLFSCSLTFKESKVGMLNGCDSEIREFFVLSIPALPRVTQHSVLCFSPWF